MNFPYFTPGKVSVIEKYKPALDRYYITQLDPVVNRLGMSGYAEESFEDGYVNLRPFLELFHFIS